MKNFEFSIYNLENKISMRNLEYCQANKINVWIVMPTASMHHHYYSILKGSIQRISKHFVYVKVDRKLKWMKNNIVAARRKEVFTYIGDAANAAIKLAQRNIKFGEKYIARMKREIQRIDNKFFTPFYWRK